MVCCAVFWMALYIVIAVALSMVCSSRSRSMVDIISTLDRYTLVQNSIIEIRAYNYYAMNLLNYWD